MSLASGTRLGPYEIVAPLGTGGMGEVYRAKDTRLGRDVAVKVLPQHLSSDPEVRARFEREARTISGLNHPNICTLFDVGSESGADYLVMELVEGETLAQRLTRGALPGPDVLRLGGQIADALDRAHRAGIVHRDLKPANVMLTKSGAKLMDFGLARAAAPGPFGGSLSQAGLTQSPTIAAPLTAEGTIVGTFQYMSPEQLEGREADARSDLWALGCVLYEMASGRRAFDGRSQASLISAIMSVEPPPVSQVAPASPPALDRLVARCLAKDPDDRWQTARDLMHELRAIGGGPPSVAGASSVSGAVPIAAAPSRRGVPRARVGAIAALALLAGGALAYAFLPRAKAPRQLVQLSMVPPMGSQLMPYSASVSISPDGGKVAYLAADATKAQQGMLGQGSALWVQSLEASGPVRLMATDGLVTTFWAPDGRTLGVVDLTLGKLFSIPLAGGSPVTLAKLRGGRGATWSRAGIILFAPTTSGPLFRIPASGGEPEQASWPDPSRHESAHRFPWFLPDGEHFLFAALPPGPEGFDIFVGALGSREVRRIMCAESAPTYAEPGYLLFRRSGKVMAQRFDARARALVGSPISIADAPPVTDLDAEPVAQASAGGKLVLLDARKPDTQLTWFDRAGAVRGTVALPPGPWDRPSLSPDDRFAAVRNGDDLWRVDLARGVAVRLTSNGTINSEPVWSPDGARVAFTSGKGHEEILVASADGSASPQVLDTTDDLFKVAEDWSREGLLVTSIDPATFRDIWLTPAVAGAKARPWLKTPFGEFRPRVSPDGHWCAYLSNEAGRDDVYVQSFPVPGHKVRVSTTGAGRVWWMPGSDEVCFRGAGSSEILCATLACKGEDLEVGEPRLLFNLPAGALGTVFSHDGQRVLSNVAAGGQGGSVRVILDWTALVER